jgi:LytS/YehU family sensor histidine kinase
MRATPEQPFQWERVWQATLGSFELGVFAYLAVLLATSFWDYYARYQAERLQAAHLRADLSAAQLETLRMQVQPHFLFNTLNAISILIEEDPRIARSMIEALSDFLRATLTEGSSQEIPLSRELELLRNYLRIEQVRFGDRLEVEMRIDEAAGEVNVPTLLLQPLVENAIRHGLARRPGRSRLEIEASLSNGSLLLAVRDRAESDSSDRLQPGDLDSPGLGIGLRNTEARLERLYGDAQSLTLRRFSEGDL